MRLAGVPVAEADELLISVVKRAEGKDVRVINFEETEDPEPDVDVQAIFEKLAQFMAVYPGLKNDLALLPVVPPGTYTIEVEVNPAYPPDKAGICPRASDPLTGQCHQFAEANYANNIGRATVIITDHPGRAGYGPLKNAKSTITASDEVEK